MHLIVSIPSIQQAMSKSANYCHSQYDNFPSSHVSVAYHLCSASDGIGIMLLCEVAAKPFFEQVQANYYADNDCKKAQAL